MTFSNLNILFFFNNSRKFWCFSDYWLNFSHLPNDFWKISPSVLFITGPGRSWERVQMSSWKKMCHEKKRDGRLTSSHTNSDYLGRLEDVLSPKTFLLFHWLSRFISFTWVVKKEGCLMQHQDSLRQFSSFGSNTLSPLALFLGSTCLLCASVILTKTFYGKLQQSLTGFTGFTCAVPRVVQQQECKKDARQYIGSIRTMEKVNQCEIPRTRCWRTFRKNHA